MTETTTRIPGLPLVHMNGTSIDALLDQRKSAWDVIKAAQKHIQAECYPHMRDYYPLRDGGVQFHIAEEKHRKRLNDLEFMANELIAEYQVIEEENEGRRR